MEFWPIFDIFHRLQPHICSKRQDLGSHKQATHRRRGDEPCSGVDRFGMAQKWSILDQNWPNMKGLSMFQNGLKGSKMVNLTVFDHLGPFLAHLDHFGPFQTKVIFFAPSRVGPRWSGEKKHSCLKRSYWVQMSPKGSRSKQLYWYLGPFCLLDHFVPLWNIDKPAMFDHFWSKMDHFWALPSQEQWTPK